MAAPITVGSKVLPLIKITWGAPQLEQGRWRGGLFTFYSASPGFPDSGFAINARAVLGWLLGLAVVGYLVLALIFTLWFRTQPHNRIGYTDVITWPIRRSHMTELRGRAWLAQGKEAIAAQRWAEGVFYLRRGLDVCPDDLDARLALAQFYLLIGRRAQAMDLFVAGVRRGVPPRAWLEAVFQIAAAGEDWSSILEICDASLARAGAPFPAAMRQRVIARKCEALIGLDRPQEALALAEAEGEAAAPEVKTQQARALLALGRAEDALVFLARWHGTAAREDRLGIQQLHVRALRESGRLAAMEEELNMICAINPTLAPVAAYAVEQRARAGRGAATALDDYIFRFGGSGPNLKLAVRLLAEVPDPRLTRRVVAEAAARGYPPQAYEAALATALLRAGDWEGLARAVQEMAPLYEHADGDSRLWYGWMKGLATELTAPPGDTQKTTLNYLTDNLVSLEAHQLTITSLRRVGQLETARDLLVISRRLYPESHWLQQEQASVARELVTRNAAVAAVAAVTAAKAPAATAPIESDDFFRKLDATIAAKNWTAARTQISELRTSRPPPPWLGTADADLLRRELRVNQALGDVLSLQLTVRLLLNLGAARADDVLAFARELDARGEKEDATTLAKAVLAKYPDHDAATDLLETWRQRDAK